MTHLAQIKALDLTKILNKDVTSEIEKLIEDYETAEDKEDFIEVTKESSALILELIEDVYPDAIAQKEKPCVEVVVTPKEVVPKPKVSPKKQEVKDNHQSEKEPSLKKKSAPKKKTIPKKKPTKQKSVSSSVKSKLQQLQEEVEECRKRGVTRKKSPRKTSTPPKTVYDKVYSHINGIANLLPERFRHDTQKISDLKRMSLGIHKKVVGVFEMNETLAEKGKIALKQKFKDINKRILANDNK